MTVEELGMNEEWEAKLSITEYSNDVVLLLCHTKIAVKQENIMMPGNIVQLITGNSTFN